MTDLTQILALPLLLYQHLQLHNFGGKGPYFVLGLQDSNEMMHNMKLLRVSTSLYA